MEATVTRPGHGVSQGATGGQSRLPGPDQPPTIAAKGHRGEDNMPAFDPKRYHRIAVEEAFIIPEIAGLDSNRVPGRSERSKLRAYIMKSLLELGDDRIQAMDRTGSPMQVLPRRRPGIQDIDPVQGNELAGSRQRPPRRVVQ